jgi:hypothetical protein
MKFDILLFFENLERIQVRMKSDRKTYIHLLWCVVELLLDWETVLTKFVQNIKTRFVLNNFFAENHVIYEIIWRNIVQPDRLQMKI